MLTWGQRLYSDFGCVACHTLTGTADAGGSLTGLIGQERTLADGRTIVADRDYVRRAILEPDADVVAGFAPKMPSYAGVLSEPQLEALLVYLESLR